MHFAKIVYENTTIASKCAIFKPKFAILLFFFKHHKHFAKIRWRGSIWRLLQRVLLLFRFDEQRNFVLKLKNVQRQISSLYAKFRRPYQKLVQGMSTRKFAMRYCTSDVADVMMDFCQTAPDDPVFSFCEALDKKALKSQGRSY